MSAFRSLPQTLWVFAGALSLAIGIIGLFLPLVPTTPFVLFTAFAFSKGSPRYHAWLMNHRHFGPMITDWQRGRIVRRKTKVMSTVVTVLMVAWPAALLTVPVFAKVLMVVCAGCALAAMWMQKEN